MTEVITRSDFASDLGVSLPSDPALDVDLRDVAVGSAAEIAKPVQPRAAAEPAPPRVRQFPAWCRRYVTAVALLDLMVGAAAFALALVAGARLDAFPSVPLAAAVFIPAWPLAIALSHGYDRSRIGVGSDEMRAVLTAMVAGIALGGFAIAMLPQVWLRSVVVVLPLLALLSLIVRFAARKVLHSRQSAGEDVRSVLIIGSALAVVSLADRFDDAKYNGMEVVAACVPDADDASLVADAGIAVAGDIEHVAAAVREFGVDAVAVTAGTPDGYLRRLAWSLENTPVELLVDPGLVEVAGPRLHIRPFAGMPLLHVEQPTFSGWKRVFKAVADVTMAGLALLALTPLWVAVALAIKAEDRGPIFFRQERVGKDGRLFKMWKFRSMVVDAEAKLATLEAQNEGAGPLFKLKRDPRITRIGAFIRRYSIDELPQLFNVLNRSMSLVGPRPPLPREVELYQTSDHRRLLVQPGLTGLWQVSGRSNLSWEESIRLDLRYVENWSFTGDLLIMWKTLFAVLGRNGAY